MPLRTSASVTAVTNSVFANCWSSQARTSGRGWSRMNSETTLVSRTIITVGSIEPGRFPHRFPWRDIQFYAAERLEQFVEGRAEVPYGGLLLPERGSQDVMYLLFQGVTMLVRPEAESLP